MPYERGKQLFPDGELEQEERSVRGTLVRGLTLLDIGLLDRFEGDVRICISSIIRDEGKGIIFGDEVRAIFEKI